MNKQEIVLVTAVEMFFEDADESKLQNMSAIWRAQGSYDTEACSVTFSMSKLIPKHMEDLPAVMEMLDGTGRLLAEQEGCKYTHAQMYMYSQHEYTEAMVKGQECEPIVFVVAQPAYE
jgi:hypothetical protein